MTFPLSGQSNRLADGGTHQVLTLLGAFAECVPMKNLTLTLLFLMALGLARAVDEPVLKDAAVPFLESETLTGAWFGNGPVLSEKGVDFMASYTAEVWGNTAGGLKTGSVYTGLLNFGSELDLEKLVGWKGAKAATTWLWLSGQDASQELVGNFMTISNIAGFNTLRMVNLWIEQSLMDGKLSIRTGVINADADFLVSDYGGLFINSEFGWAMMAGMNIPNGGAAFPMGAPGLRVSYSPCDAFSFLSGVYQGNVFAQDVNRYGFRWRLDAQNGFTWMNEAQLFWGKADESKVLPGCLKVGAWFQSGQYADALAESTASGNEGFYISCDQMLFREKADCSPKSDEGLGCFCRTGFTPPDRNVVDFFVDAGLTYKGLIPGRDEDSLGLAYGFAGVSSDARDSIGAASGVGTLSEMVLEATYQCALTPCCVLQPDAQLILNPGGNNSAPNAFVIGARVAITF